MYDAIADFEEEIKKFTGAKHAIAVCNGTAALHVALLAIGVGCHDEVITTPFTFIASANAILYCGARPRFADIKEDDYTIDPSSVEKILKNHQPKALLCVHLFGNACDLNSLRVICEKHHIILVEDCAQALGVTYEGAHVGRFGKVGIFSFYATKNLSTFEGGMVITDSDEIAKKVRILINQGQDRKYHHIVLGFNYRMPKICALIGAEYLRCHKTAIIAEIGLYGVENGHYPTVIYKQPLYKELGITGDCPIAEKVAKEAKKHFRG